MQYDRPLSAIVPSSRSARPFPSRMATTVLCSTIGPSAPSYPAHVQLVHPPRMATNVLCTTIGPSAPSCPDSRFGSLIPFQDGDDRLMQYDRPLSAIVPSSRSARPSPQGGDERLMHHDRPLSAIVSRFTVRLAHSLQDGDDRLMQYDRPLSAIVPSSRSARPFPPGWRRTSYAPRSAPQSHRVWLMFGSPIPSRMATNVSHAAQSAPPCHCVGFISRLPIPSRMATTILCSMSSSRR
ncbi:unnamed protein product [Cuscuta epithymum]|uniref:Uncharacterized protein n=1 Tax=Cuscuta epithymum TaxID=186058 RepID=A0AAV0DGH0_9ASTE|nr:unnamed protein product [Cuscuta epithymum]